MNKKELIVMFIDMLDKLIRKIDSLDSGECLKTEVITILSDTQDRLNTRLLV